MTALALAFACISAGTLLACAALAGLDAYSVDPCAPSCADSGDDSAEESAVASNASAAGKGSAPDDLDGTPGNPDDASNLEDDASDVEDDASDADTVARGLEAGPGGGLADADTEATPDSPTCGPGSCGASPLDAGEEQPECNASECTNLCVPYFIQCCKTDQSCGCALLFPRGPCN